MADHTTAAKVKVWLKLTDAQDDAIVTEAVAAANAFVTALPQHGETITPRSTTGATMLASRYYRRKNTPGGIDAIGPDNAAVYVPRRDSDVDQLLGLGAWQSPTGVG